MAGKVKDMGGCRFTRLLVVDRAESDANGNARWHCQCDCGNTTITSGFTLRNGEAKSCGCLTTEQLKQRNLTHGRTKTPEYTSWASMLQRCENPKNVKYHHYGARGIKVCERWRNFQSFYADMGLRPSPKHTLERLDNELGYEPKNCAWATKSQQNYNKRDNHLVTYRGQIMPLGMAILKSGSGVNRSTIQGRLGRGWSTDAAIDTPVDPNVQTPFTGQRHPSAK